MSSRKDEQMQMPACRSALCQRPVLLLYLPPFSAGIDISLFHGPLR